MECFGTTDFDNNSRLITLSTIIISGLHCIIKSDLKDVLNQMFIHNQVSHQQKHAIVVPLPKSNGDPTPEGFRPISLLTTEYKILARIMVRRLRPIMAEHLRSSQFCAVPGNSILYAVATVHDAITYAEATGTPICVLTLDFESAFDRMSHHYLFNILRRYGISHRIIERIRNLYDGATASIQINGMLTGRIPIQCEVREGCPLSMVLYALCLYPLLRTLEDRLHSIHIGGHKADLTCSDLCGRRHCTSDPTRGFRHHRAGKTHLRKCDGGAAKHT